ncbi:MAG TPA: sulfite exporter TauE/SafE family protein [Burkholderiales bacterium]|nr:sulfite exporter TauE/SafE family protein [Burkholderiales bacterium]
MTLLDLSPLALAYCIAVLILNFTLRGSLGFGGALGLPLLALAIPVKVIAPAWSLVGIVSSIAIAGHGRRHIDWREFKSVLPGCALGIVAGLVVFKALDTVMLARALGAFIIVYAAYSWWLGTRPPGARPPLRQGILRPAASVLSGIVGTIFGAMATIFFAIYMDAGKMGKDAFRATMSAMILSISIARAAGYAAVGELTLDSVILCAATIPAMGIGLLVGDRLHTGLSPLAFQRFVCIALAATGVALLLTS